MPPDDARKAVEPPLFLLCQIRRLGHEDGFTMAYSGKKGDSLQYTAFTRYGMVSVFIPWYSTWEEQAAA